MNVIRVDKTFHTSKFERDDREGIPRSVEQALDCLERSMLVIDENLRILHANTHARATLGGREDETNFSRYIVGDAPSQSLDLRRKISVAVVTRGRAIVPLNHPGHGRLICAVKGVTPFGSAHSQGLVALSPEGPPAADVAPYLCDVYKLSRTEAEIAISAARGLELSQIMLERKVSIHTLRAQIASIKAKMGLNRMTEVAVTIARIQAAALI